MVKGLQLLQIGSAMSFMLISEVAYLSMWCIPLDRFLTVETVCVILSLIIYIVECIIERKKLRYMQSSG